MSRAKDNIDRDVAAAMRLGYGVHYGHYKADHPHTQDTVPETQIPEAHMKACKYCGRPFSTRGRHYRKLYCDDECRQAYNSIRNYQTRQKREVDKNAKTMGEQLRV